METSNVQPFSLVDPWQKDYLKFDGRAPRTLEELAIARAESKHRGRMAELKALRAKLALLDAFARPLWDRGIKLGQREVGAWTMDRKVIRIDSGAFFEPDDKLYAAFLELGFHEIARKDWSRTDIVTLKHGRALLVAIEVSKRQVDARPPTGQSEAAPAAAGVAA